MPLGKYATFEEFEEFGISDQQSGQWLLDLQSFVVNQRTNRMFYNHPPGARGHLPALAPMLQRADWLQAMGKFKWYTMTEMAQFGNRRLDVQWNASTSNGFATFSASHASSLKDMTWLLPRDKYMLPVDQRLWPGRLRQHELDHHRQWRHRAEVRRRPALSAAATGPMTRRCVAAPSGFRQDEDDLSQNRGRLFILPSWRLRDVEASDPDLVAGAR